MTGVDIEKSLPGIAAGARVGASIAYTVTIRTRATATLTRIQVTDDRTGTFDAPLPATLAPGATVSRTFTSTITPADAAAGNVDNSVTVKTKPAGAGTDAALRVPVHPGDRCGDHQDVPDGSGRRAGWRSDRVHGDD